MLLIPLCITILLCVRLFVCCLWFYRFLTIIINDVSPCRTEIITLFKLPISSVRVTSLMQEVYVNDTAFVVCVND